ncbi:uncharacterized protein [Argopecten irradians]|uniref:uncharacterized protein isoform X2 n=1 Tax=Argopecten irradians TaxID=31199 RepID=UPI0037134DC4
MVRSCVVYKCFNKADDRGKENCTSFFRFPKNKRKRQAWIKAVNRENWNPTDASYICSEHFDGGWHSDDPEDVNYRPTLFSYKQSTASDLEQARASRLLRRRKEQEILEAEKANKDLLQRRHRFSVMSNDYSLPPEAAVEDIDVVETDMEIDGEGRDDTNVKSVKEAGMQTDVDPVFSEREKLGEELKKTKEELRKTRWNADKIRNDDAKTKFYTGLPTYAIFIWLFNFLKRKAERMTFWTGPAKTANLERTRQRTGSLELIDQFFVVLTRLRLGLFTQDVADRAGISIGTFSKYFTTWICLLHEELKLLNPFPSREIVNRTMPEAFKIKYPSVRVIIDCTEIFIQRSSNLVNQNVTFSNYKHHNTFKFLVGITPSGVISFVSEGWGGRVSDRQITIHSGILNLLQENDSVMADKGFTIRDLLEEKKCHLNIPPFRGTAAQFSTEEVFETQEIAELRIHVERSIGRVKNFHILDGVLPLSLAPLASKIFRVACWLSNFDVALVTK